MLLFKLQYIQSRFSSEVLTETVQSRAKQQFHDFGVLFDCGSNGVDWACHHWLWFNAFFHLVQGNWDYWILDAHLNTVINISSHSTLIHTFLLKVYCTQHWCGLHGDVSVHTEACPLWSSQCAAAAADIHPGAFSHIHVCYTKDKPWPLIARVFFSLWTVTQHTALDWKRNADRKLWPAARLRFRGFPPWSSSG